MILIYIYLTIGLILAVLFTVKGFKQHKKLEKGDIHELENKLRYLAKKHGGYFVDYKLINDKIFARHEEPIKKYFVLGFGVYQDIVFYDKDKRDSFQHEFKHLLDLYNKKLK